PLASSSHSLRSPLACTSPSLFNTKTILPSFATSARDTSTPAFFAALSARIRSTSLKVHDPCPMDGTSIVLDRRPSIGPGGAYDRDRNGCSRRSEMWVKESSHLLHGKWIFHFHHSGQYCDIAAAACVPLCSCKLLFVTPEPNDSRIEFTFDLREDFIET